MERVYKVYEGRANIHDEVGQGRKFVVTVGFVQHVDPVGKVKQKLKIR